MSPSPSTRWCPTPEQLMILEELYRRGLRTPNSCHIQKITAHLSFYGKIQGKNVFYWFQNHKARDRQKLRKKLLHQHQHQLQLHHRYLYPTTTQFHPHSFPDPLLGLFQSSNSFSPQILPPLQDINSPVWHEQVGASGDVAAKDQAPRQPWTSDLPKDCLMRKYGQDSTEAASTLPPWPCCRNRPLQTLELFPLISPNASNLK